MSKPANPEYHSTSVRPIENGYLVSTSHEGPNGYESKETYHETKPTISTAVVSSPRQQGKTQQSSNLRSAIDCALKGGSHKRK